jgi:tetratricopeptide (TPR) repeat protein
MKIVVAQLGPMLLAAALLVSCSRSPEARRDHFVDKGKKLLQKQDYARAVLEFRNAIRVSPEDAEAYYQLGVAFSGQGDLGKAFMAYRQALTIRPKYVEAQLRMAQIQLVSGDEALTKDANQRLKALVGDSHATAEVLNTLAFTELRLGNMESAIQSFEGALAQSPGELLSSVMLARAKLSQNDAKGAEGILIKACTDLPQSADARRILGEFYAYQGRTAEADAELRRTLTLDAKNGLALMDLGRLASAAGRNQEAEQMFKRASALDAFKSVYAAFLYEAGRRDESVREYERLSKDDPEDRKLRTDLIMAYRRTNREADADQLLDKAVKSNPGDTDALLQRGEIALERGQFDQAEADVQKVLKLKPSAPEAHYIFAKLNQNRGLTLLYRQELSEALQLNPALLPIRVELMQNLVNANEAKAALALLDSAPAYQRTMVPILVQRNWAHWALGELGEMRKGIDQGLAQEKTLDLLIQDGLWRLRNGDPIRARAVLEDALKLNPSDMRALVAIKHTYVAQNNSSMAVRKVKEYALQYPKSASVQNFLGTMLMGSGDRLDARKAFTTAVETNPGLLEAEMNLVQLDVADGKIEDARARLEKVIAKASDNVTAHRWLGNLEEMSGNHNKAIQHFRQVVARDPQDPQATNNLAYLLSEHANQVDEALKFAQKAVELAPTRPAYCDTLGWVLYHKGLYTSAIPYLERANADAGSVVWKYHLAMAYAKAGDVTRGRTLLTAALKVNPNVPEAKIARDLILVSR